VSGLWRYLVVTPLAVLLGCAVQPSVAPEGATTPAAAAAGAAGGVAAVGVAGVLATAAAKWKQVYSTDFPVDAPLGSFSGCQASTYTCTGLPAALQSQWWAYPDGWSDTATQRDMRVGGYYSPSTTVWIADGVMNIRMWRGTGSVHSAALLPKAAMDRTYGKYVETFRVVHPAPGFKSAHMLWAGHPTDGSAHEIDFPEAGWGVAIKAFVHYATHRPYFHTDTPIDSTWHTTIIEWTPRGLSLYLDGKLVGSQTGRVSDVPMRWILQNETQTDGAAFPHVNSSSTMQIKYVAYYSWAG